MPLNKIFFQICVLIWPLNIIFKIELLPTLTITIRIFEDWSNLEMSVLKPCTLCQKKLTRPTQVVTQVLNLSFEGDQTELSTFEQLFWT